MALRDKGQTLRELFEERDALRARVAELGRELEHTRDGLGQSAATRLKAQERAASLQAEVERLTTELARAENLVKTFNESLKDERAMTNEANARVKTAEQALAESERKRAATVKDYADLHVEHEALKETTADELKALANAREAWATWKAALKGVKPVAAYQAEETLARVLGK